jgi:hypothetical protein
MMTEATTRENITAALLGAVLVGGVYSDGWAHLNIGGMDSFFTPWHGVLYGGFALLTLWLAWMAWRRRDRSDRWADRVPTGYGWGLVGVAVFAVGGLLDMVWHTIFGIEAGIDALVSPTHLLLLTGGVAGGTAVDLILALRPALPTPALAGLVPGLVWAGQLTGLAGAGWLRWPVELWSGVAVLSVLVAVALAWLTRPNRLQSENSAPDRPTGGPGARLVVHGAAGPNGGRVHSVRERRRPSKGTNRPTREA